MRFFQRLTSLTPPEDPLEGALKMLLFSQLITAPITMFTDFDTEEKLLQTSVIINTIHMSAVLMGFSWGAFNWCIADENPDENQHRHIQNRV